METLMSNAKPLDLSLPYQVADISLADFGKKEMQLSEREMPGLMELIRRYGDKKPLKGFHVMGAAFTACTSSRNRASCCSRPST